MRRGRPSFSSISLGVLAIVVALAALQVGRRWLQAADGGRGQSKVPACAHARLGPAGSETVAAADSSAIVVRLDYAGAEGLLDALARDSLSEADVDSLLRIAGLCAMVDNVTRFFPAIGAPEFRRDVRAFARTKKPGKHDGWFRLSDVWRTRAATRALLSTIRTNERRMMDATVSQLESYRPDTAAIRITAYLVLGGVSTGFAFEDDPSAFYANLVDAKGDLGGIVSNMAHEAYHALQARAQQRAGIDPRWILSGYMGPVERLFAGTLAEGTAKYVTEQVRWTGTPSDARPAREAPATDPRRMARDFALFDAVLAKLRTGRMTWDDAYREGFTSKNDDSFYLVGSEMTRSLERHCGRACIRQLFGRPPVEFFRRYIALYREHPELAGRFSPETEASVAAFARGSPK